MPYPQGPFPAKPMPEGPGFAHLYDRVALPLAGVTLLAVEDSRFASEALRLLCQRSGARMRRAETLAAARRHLAVYRPDVVLVDLGLPDGNGADLIRELTRGQGLGSLVLAISGDPDGWSQAVRAGAAGFLEKPLQSLAAFQKMILTHLQGQSGLVPRADDKPIQPDPQALQDDLLHAADLIAQGDENPRRYVVDFVSGIARSSNDTALACAAASARTSTEGMIELGALLGQRISHCADPFAIGSVAGAKAGVAIGAHKTG
ncbi:response regulator (plasmid) [Pseudorhodobacter turbinis]|uniref:Response regulator n=1 Tax=Pseudorhodobacter turbinis TaxID=2500533 RepID=A0A4P8EJ76_9RHOB|nr:response regulator [Pseudorhodobacter turbinis]QCO57230.1 response regulator [Pseudorhodobacter turbinis]